MKHILRRFSLFIFCSLFILGSFAQRAIQSVSFSAGSAGPINYFGSTKPGDLRSGFAKTGGMADVRYEYKPCSFRLGFVANIRGKVNSIDNVPLLYPGARNAGYQVPPSRSSLKSAAILVGITFRLRGTSRFSLDYQLMIGVARSWFSKAAVRGVRPDFGSSSTGDYFMEQTTGSTATGLSEVFKLGPAYRINKNTEVFFNGDLWSIQSKMTISGRFETGQGTIVPGKTVVTDPKNQFIGLFENGAREKNPNTSGFVAGFRVYF